MFGTVMAAILGACVLIFGVVIICVTAGNYFMDGSWRWGVRDDSKDKTDTGDKKDS